jgi:hypothetical protein
MLQDARAWLSNRFARLELVAEHASSVLGSALNLIDAELTAIRAARTELDI